MSSDGSTSPPPRETSTGATGSGPTVSAGMSSGTGWTASTTGGAGAGGASLTGGSAGTTGSTATTSGGGGPVGSGGAGGSASSGAGGTWRDGGSAADSGAASGMSCGRPTVPVTSSIISTFDGPADPLDSMAVSPAGKWTVETDGTGATLLKVEDTSDPALKMAAHFSGAGHASWGAAMQTNLSGAEMSTGVDASAYAGISFDIETGAANMATSLVVKLENEDAIPACNLCNDSVAGKDCHAGYVFTQAITAGPGWSTVTIPFAMFDASSYGNHASAQIDRRQIISLTLALYLKVLPFDLWIDNVRFSK